CACEDAGPPVCGIENAGCTCVGGGMELARRGGVVIAELASVKGCGGGAGSLRRVMRCAAVTPSVVRVELPVATESGSPCVWCAPTVPSCVSSSGGATLGVCDVPPPGDPSTGGRTGGAGGGSRTPVVLAARPPDVVTRDGPSTSS